MVIDFLSAWRNPAVWFLNTYRENTSLVKTSLNLESQVFHRSHQTLYSSPPQTRLSTAHLDDMADQPSHQQGDPERQPLLAHRRDPEDPSGDVSPSPSRAKRAAVWFARHAVPLFIVMLFIAVFAILLSFLRRESNTTSKENS